MHRKLLPVVATVPAPRTHEEKGAKANLHIHKKSLIKKILAASKLPFESFLQIIQLKNLTSKNESQPWEVGFMELCINNASYQNSMLFFCNLKELPRYFNFWIIKCNCFETL